MVWNWIATGCNWCRSRAETVTNEQFEYLIIFLFMGMNTMFFFVGFLTGMRR